MEIPTLLYDRTIKCRIRFIECFSSSTAGQREWCENRLADFNLWAAGLGASSAGHASLDYRLLPRPDLQDVILDLLEEILETLDVVDRRANLTPDLPSFPCIQPEEEGLLQQNPGSRKSSVSSSDLVPEPTSPWSELSDDIILGNDQSSLVTSDRALSEATQSIESILDQLSRLSVAIRRSGGRFRYQIADRNINLLEYEEFMNHLTFMVLLGSCYKTYVEPGTLQVLRKDIPSLAELTDPSRLTAIQSRLIRANVKRRNRFKYAKRREREKESQRLQKQTDFPRAGRQPNTPSALQPRKTSSSGLNPQGKKESEERTKITPAIIATALGSDLVVTPMKSTKAASGVTKVSLTGAKLDYPHPPYLTKDQQIFECPYCCQALPIKYSKKGWRGHVLQDVRPYVCIFENCQREEDLFASTEEWIRHMELDHSKKQWICSVCDSTESLVFKSEDEFVKHLRETPDHIHSITEEQLPIVVKKNMRVTPLKFHSCPLCLWLEDGNNKNISLEQHVAEHLHSFALMALPWDDKAENSERTDEVVRSIKYNASDKESEYDSSQITQSIAETFTKEVSKTLEVIFWMSTKTKMGQPKSLAADLLSKVLDSSSLRSDLEILFNIKVDILEIEIKMKGMVEEKATVQPNDFFKQLAALGEVDHHSLITSRIQELQDFDIVHKATRPTATLSPADERSETERSIYCQSIPVGTVTSIFEATERSINALQRLQGILSSFKFGQLAVSPTEEVDMVLELVEVEHVTLRKVLHFFVLFKLEISRFNSEFTLYPSTGFEFGKAIQTPWSEPYGTGDEGAIFWRRYMTQNIAGTWNYSTHSGHNDYSDRSKVTSRNIQGLLDPAFQVHHPKEFAVGKVIKAPWSEPYGSVKKGVQNYTDILTLQDSAFGQKIYSSIRRFVIVQVYERHCKCIPILTYQGQGTRKSGVKPQEHAIIYSKDPRNRGPPAELKGEQKLLKKPICVDVFNKLENLDPKSRLNYAKVYTIEYNVRVVFIGTVNKKSKKYFKRDYNKMHPPLSYSPGSGLSDSGLSDNGLSDNEVDDNIDPKDGRGRREYNRAVSDRLRRSVSYAQNSSGSNYEQTIREPQGGGRSTTAYHYYSNTANYESRATQSPGGRQPSTISTTNLNTEEDDSLNSSHHATPSQGPSYDYDYNANYPDDESPEYHQASNYRY